MSINRLFAFYLLMLCVGVSLSASSTRERSQDPLLGPWSGEVHYGTESKFVTLRFELDKNNSTVMFLDLPDLKFHNLGPLPVKWQGDEYKAYVLSFRLASDNKGLSGLWSFDGHDLPFDLKPGAPTIQPTPAQGAGRIARPAWTFKTGGPIWSSPAVAENTVYFGSTDGMIYALKTNDGKLIWQFKSGGKVMGPVTLDGQYLYTLSDDGYLYKLQRQTGKQIWRFDTHGGNHVRDMPGSGTQTYDYQTSGASVVNGTVYVGSADKRLYAVDAEDGREKWHFDTHDIVRSTPAVAGGQVFFGSYDHNIYAVDADTGALKWKCDTLREVLSSPLVVNGTVYIGSRCSDLFALDATTGKVKWKYFYWSSWVESSARLRDGILYVGSSDSQQLFAIDSATGRRKWSFDTDGSDWSTPAVTDKRVYIGSVGVVNYIIDHHGGFFAVDRASGKAVWRYPMTVMPGSVTYGVASSPAVAHGLVFFGGLDGKFYVFRADD